MENFPWVYFEFYYKIRIFAGCGNACRLLCCLRPTETSPQIWKINEGIKDLSKKLDQLERRNAANEHRRNSSQVDNNDSWLEEDEQAELDDDIDMKRQSQAALRNKKWKNMSSEAWLGDKYLKRFPQKKIVNDLLRTF